MRTTVTSLEGLRGAAALLVVFHHMFYAPPHQLFGSAYLCVDLFFVLSGFVICRAYGEHLCDPTQLRTFIIRRVGRLWPAHIATSVLAIAVARHVPSIGEVLALATLSQGLNVFSDGVGNVVSWSISDELFVYLAFGALCFMLRGKARVAAFVLLALGGYLFAVWIALRVERCQFAGNCFGSMTFSFGWTRCLAGFFMGALICEFRDRIAALAGKQVVQITAFAASLLMVLYANALPGAGLIAPPVFAVLVGSLLTDRGPVARLFQTGPAQYLGKVSYSLYLGHGVLFLQLASQTVGTDMKARLVPYALFLFWSFGFAHLLHKYVEMPFRERFNRWSQAVPASTVAYTQIKEPQ